MLKRLPVWYLQALPDLVFDALMADILARPDGALLLITETSPQLR